MSYSMIILQEQIYKSKYLNKSLWTSCNLHNFASNKVSMKNCRVSGELSFMDLEFPNTFRTFQYGLFCVQLNIAIIAKVYSQVNRKTLVSHTHIMDMHTELFNSDNYLSSWGQTHGRVFVDQNYGRHKLVL